MSRLNEAWKVLSDHEKRAEYDKKISSISLDKFYWLLDIYRRYERPHPEDLIFESIDFIGFILELVDDCIITHCRCGGSIEVSVLEFDSGIYLKECPSCSLIYEFSKPGG